MAAPPTVVVSSLNEVAAELVDRNINTTAQYDLVQFELHEQVSLQEAAKINAKIRGGMLGFALVNPELLRCKTDAKVALEMAFNEILDASVDRADQELQLVEESIAALRILVRRNDNQIGHQGPPLNQRNLGVKQCLYASPPFPEKVSLERSNTRVPYQPGFATDAERDAARARDILAQRAVWEAKLCILESRQTIMKDQKFEMITMMRQELRRLMEQPSNLGVGYADYDDPPLA